MRKFIEIAFTPISSDKMDAKLFVPVDSVLMVASTNGTAIIFLDPIIAHNVVMFDNLYTCKEKYTDIIKKIQDCYKD